MIKTLFVLSILFLNCSSNNIEDKISLRIGNDAEIDLSKYVDSVSIINLEQKDEFYISDYVSSIEIIDSAIYFIDKRQDILYKYNVNGSAINKFERKGKSKNEYINISDFTFVKDKLFVLCFPYKLFILDKNFNIENVLKLNYDYQNIQCVGEDLLLYCHENRETHSLDIGNKTTTTIITDSKRKYNIIYRHQSIFNKLNDSLLIVSMCGSDVLYEMTNGSIIPALKLDYKNKEKNYNKINNISQDDVLAQMKYAQPTILDMIKTEKYLYINYSFKARFRMLIYDNYLKTVIEDGFITNGINFSSSLTKINNKFCSILDFGSDSIVNNIEKYNVSKQQLNRGEELNLCIYNMK